MISRRDFLVGISGAFAAAGTVHPLLSWSLDQQEIYIFD